MRKFRELYQKRTPSNVPALPDNVDDNFYLASASKAAEIDKLSGAYDEFLFSEDGLTQMPFERAVDDHLALVEMRLLDRGRRAVLIEKHKLIDAEAEVTKLLRREEAIQAEIDQRQEKIIDQAEILAGNKTGKANLYWPGSIPVQTSMTNGIIRLAAPYFVFLLVGLVDVGLIFLSFNAIFGDWRESLILTLPALGIQIVFPHFIGSRISLLLHKPPKVLFIWVEIFLLLSMWLAFAITISEIRINFVMKTASPELRAPLYFGLLFMLLGLGIWLIVNEIRHNPHETKYARLLFSASRLKRKLEKNRFRIAKTTGLIPAIESSLEVAEKSFEDSIQAARTELADAAKSVYRRSLVNQLGEVDFTSAYLASGSSPSAGREARRKKNDLDSKNTDWRKTPRQKAEEAQNSTESSTVVEQELIEDKN